MSSTQHDPLFAAREGDLAELRSLIAKGPAAARATNSRDTPQLHYAAEGEQAAAVEYLVSQGADLSALDNDGHRPLHRAAV